MKNIQFWLTLTWDVLKSKNEKKEIKTMARLTLTWDVLKSLKRNMQVFL